MKWTAGIRTVGMLAAQETGGYERLFGLDPQLLHDTVFTGAAVFFLFFVLSYFLFNPARDLLQKRREAIAKDLEGAKASREEARRLEEAFEEQMEQADKVAQEKVRETEKRAAKAETVLIREAKKEAESIRLRAQEEIRQQKRQAAKDLRREVISIAAAMAKKAAASQMTVAIQDALVEETLREMEEDTWRGC